MRIVFAFVFIHAFQMGIAQYYEHYLPDDIYQLASQAVEDGKLELAEKYFTRLIEYYPAKDWYYNRAQIRNTLNDTCGYCADLFVSSHYFGDKIAKALLIKSCAVKSDSIFLDQKFLSLGEFEEARYIKCWYQFLCDSVETRGEIIDLEKTHMFYSILPKQNHSLFDPSAFKTDRVAHFYIDDSVEIYTFHPNHSIGTLKYDGISTVRKELFSRLSMYLDTASLARNFELKITIILDPKNRPVEISTNLDDRLKGHHRSAYHYYLMTYFRTNVRYVRQKKSKQKVFTSRSYRFYKPD